MKNHATNPSKTQDTKPQIQYTQRGQIKRLSCSGVPFSQALEIWTAFTTPVAGGAK